VVWVEQVFAGGSSLSGALEDSKERSRRISGKLEKVENRHTNSTCDAVDQEHLKIETCGMGGTSFSGGSLPSRASLEILEILEKLLEHARKSRL
jgi:hypothetical protein